MIAPYLARLLSLMVRDMATFLHMRRFVQPQELPLEQTLSMEIHIWTSTSITELIIYGGMCCLPIPAKPQFG